jgi:nitrite reductase/ring-hydroxylating ferredoxin subunit
MLSREENELLTRVGPGTAMGATLRRYWLPALLTEEVPTPDCPPVRVRLVGEDLIAFRDTSGQVGLLGAYCPHRRAPLFFGRNEEHGLRCMYHGWKFDRAGACVDMPNEPEESTFRFKIHQTAYPCEERGGVVWAYLGPADKRPPLPGLEWLRAPAGCAHVSKTFEECNYLQALEGGVDSSHSSFLHHDRSRVRPQATIGYRGRAGAPRLEVLTTPYGFTYASIRHLREELQNYVRVYQFVMPFYQLRAFEGYQGRPLLQGHIWVPVDDEHTYVYNWLCAADDARLPPELIEEVEREAGRGPDDLLPGYRLKRNKGNDYLIDRELQRAGNSIGVRGINTQDFALQEGMGPIVDRSEEHLGTSDLAIITTRRLLLQAARDVAAGGDPLGVDAGDLRVRPAEMVLPEGVPWAEAMQEALVAHW